MRLRRLTFLSALSIILVAGCSDDPAGGNNNNTGGVDAAPSADAGPDSTVPGEDGGPCTPDDLWEQQSCGPGEKCTVVNPADETRCAPSGPQGFFSACDETRPDNCAIGSLCSDAKDAGNFICLPYCPPFYGIFCDGGFCVLDDNLPGGVLLCEPADQCNPVNSSGCDPGQSCYLAPVGDEFTFCDPPGAIARDQPCTVIPNQGLPLFECAPGHVCFGPDGPGNGICTEVCDLNNPVCSAGQCMGFAGPTWGICQ